VSNVPAIEGKEKEKEIKGPMGHSAPLPWLLKELPSDLGRAAGAQEEKKRRRRKKEEN